MSQNQAIDGQWRLLIDAASRGSWQEYKSAEKRLLSVDRLGKIGASKLRAVKVIALARGGYTNDAAIECNTLQKEEPDLVQSFVVPRLKKAPEQNSEEFVSFTESLIKTAQRKAFVHSIQQNTVQGIAGFFRIDKTFKKHWATSSVVAGIILISIVGWYRFSANSSPTSFFYNFSKAVETNNPSLVWNSIPSSLQEQANSLIQELGRKIPPGAGELMDAQWAANRRVIKLLENKRKFIMNTPVVKGLLIELSPNQKEQVDEIYDEVIPLLNTISTSQLSTINGLQNFDIAKFFDRNGQQIMNFALKLSTIASQNNIETMAILQQYKSLAYLEATVITEGSTTATVEVAGLLPSLYGLNSKVPMIKMEGKWFPSELAMGMQLGILQARQEIANLPNDLSIQMEDGAMMGISITLINSLITPLEKATTQVEFDNALVEISLKLPRFSNPYF